MSKQLVEGSKTPPKMTDAYPAWGTRRRERSQIMTFLGRPNPCPTQHEKNEERKTEEKHHFPKISSPPSAL